MVKRIQQVLIIILILALLPFNAVYAANDDDNYTSLYYSDTSELEEVRIIDSLYEYGLMDGIIPPTDKEKGVFIANDYVTIHQFYAIMNKLLDTNIEYQGKPGFLYHYRARIIFKVMMQEKNIDLNATHISLDIPKIDKEYLTRLELAKWIYSYAIYNGIIEIPTKGDKIANYSLQFLGCSYVYGGNGPKAFDCSGFTRYIMKHFGYTIGRTCSAQCYNGSYVSRNNLLPGDIVLFERTYASSGLTHAGLYIGNDQFIHAANSRTGVIISSLLENYYSSRFVCGRRVWEDD